MPRSSFAPVKEAGAEPRLIDCARATRASHVGDELIRGQFCDPPDGQRRAERSTHLLSCNLLLCRPVV